MNHATHLTALLILLTLAGCASNGQRADIRVLDRRTGETVVLAAVQSNEAAEISSVVAPYSTDAVIGTFGDCRKGGRQHRALDLADKNDFNGLGNPIFAMAHSRVEYIGRPEDDPDAFGRRDTRSGDIERAGRTYPSSRDIEGYGTVYFFTRDAGSWRSGEVIVTRGLSGELEGHQIRYMHLGAVHPDLEVGDELVPGQEIAVMGGTGVQKSVPHLHVDLEDPSNRRLDVAPFLGLPADTTTCREKR